METSERITASDYAARRPLDPSARGRVDLAVRAWWPGGTTSSSSIEPTEWTATPRASRWIRRLLAPTIAVACLTLSVAVGHAQSDGRGAVLVATISDAITPVIADHLEDGIARAERDEYAAFVIVLDTPGGLDTSMRDIIQDILDADVPVIVYVAPRGGRAASAGALITFAAHVAAMAPGTTIGAATPVQLEGGGDVEQKIVNDAAAYAEALADLRDRDPEFARDTVEEGRAASASEAVEIRAVDLLATSMSDLLEAVDGRTVEVGDQTVTLETADARTDDYDLGFFRSVLQFLADPNIAFLLLSLGTLGLIYELATPGVGLAGVAGATMLLLALFALAVLPVNVVGIVLLVVAMALFVAEVLAPGFAGFAAGGAVLLTLSGVFLFDDAPGLETSLAVVLPVGIVVGGAVLLAGRIAWRTRSAPATFGDMHHLVGREVVVRLTAGERGQAFVDGSWWSIRPREGAHPEGERVRVADVDGIVLITEPIGDQETAEDSGPGVEHEESR